MLHKEKEGSLRACHKRPRLGKQLGCEQFLSETFHPKLTAHACSAWGQAGGTQEGGWLPAGARERPLLGNDPASKQFSHQELSAC